MDAEKLRAEGQAFVESGQLLKATKAFMKASKAAPSSEIFNHLSATLLSLNKFKQAAEAAQKAIALQPENVKSHCLLGTASFELNLPDQALCAFEQALRLDPECEEARAFQATLLRIQMKEQSAAERKCECICGYFASAHQGIAEHLAHPNNQERTAHREKTADDLLLDEAATLEASTRQQLLADQAAAKKEAGAHISRHMVQQFSQCSHARADRLKQSDVQTHFVGADVLDPSNWQGLGLPRLIVLVGAQGSGKSTLAEQLEARGWLRVNDSAAAESQKIRQRRQPIQLIFEEVLKEGLRAGRRVVVDRANCEPKQRARWVDVAATEGVRFTEIAFAVLDTPLDLCQERVKLREGHHLTEKHISVVATWHEALTSAYPSTEDRVGGVFSLSNPDIVNAFLELMDLTDFG